MNLTVLAGLVGVSAAYLSMVESGKRNIDRHSLIIALAEALGVPPGELAPGMAVKRNRLAARRKAVGFSQEQLAEQLGIDRSTVGRWESGETAPQPWIRPRLGKVLQLSADRLDGLLAEGAPDSAAETSARLPQVPAGDAGIYRPTLLRSLIMQRHWQKFETFQVQFSRAAGELAECEGEPRLADLSVSARQYERWYSGDVKTAPLPDACRVLEHMFGFTIQQLLGRDISAASAPAITAGASSLAVSDGCAADSARMPADFWARDDVSRAVIESDIPDFLALVVRERQWTQRRLAKVVGYSQSWISNVMRRDQPLTVKQAREILLRFSAPLDRLTLALNPDATDLNRRTLLQGMAALGVPPFKQSATPSPDLLPRIPNRSADVPPEIAGYFRTQLEAHYLADLLLGPRQLIGTVSGQYEMLSQLAETAGGEIRADLLRIGAAFTGFITWLYQDAGDFYRAAHWASETLDLAHRVQDIQIIGHALVNKAMLNSDLGYGKRAAELSEAAMIPDRKLCAKVRVQAMQQAAHGYSMFGERARVDELLDGAARLTAEIDDDYPWGNASRRSPDYIEAQRATCYGRLGLSSEASRIWEQVINRMPDRFQRDKGVYIARRAIAAADAGQPDIAAALICESAPMAANTGSARMRQELQAAWQHFEPWQHSAIGKEVSEKLAGIGIHEKGS
jgi:transcriptional regulator with XRE-family HTH domain